MQVNIVSTRSFPCYKIYQTQAHWFKKFIGIASVTLLNIALGLFILKMRSNNTAIKREQHPRSDPNGTGENGV